MRLKRAAASRKRTQPTFMTEHVTDERLIQFIIGRLELTDGEEEHIRNCQNCNDRFRTFLTSGDNAKAS